MRHGLFLLVPALVLALPAAAQTKAEAEALVKKTVAYAKANGVEKCLHEVNNPAGQLKNGDLYIFVYDLNGTVMAHGANTKMIGKNLMKTQDGDGKFYVMDLVTLGKTQGKGWLAFKFPNPVTRAIEPKVAYVELYDGLVFGSGVYGR